MLLIPFLIGIVQIPEAIYYNLNARDESYSLQMSITGSISGIAIILSEFIMYYILVRKLLAFGARNSTVWVVKITLTLGVLITLDIAEIIFYFVSSDLSTLFYSFSFNVRLNAVILFFGDLVTFVKSGQAWLSYQQTPINSGDQEVGNSSTASRLSKMFKPNNEAEN